MAKVPAPRISRGEIWLVNFNPSTGAEIKKLRPAIVVSLDSVGRLPLRIVVPVTDWNLRYSGFPWFVFLPADAQSGLAKDSGADAFQVKSVSVYGFNRLIGSVTDTQLEQIASAIALAVGAS
jgi:mRNA interferase MazF